MPRAAILPRPANGCGEPSPQPSPKGRGSNSGSRSDDSPNSFAGLGKIAALGIKVSRHCTYHCVALNVAMDLEPFSRINPCGYEGLQTTDLRSLGVNVTWDEAARVLAEKLVARLAP